MMIDPCIPEHLLELVANPDNDQANIMKRCITLSTINKLCVFTQTSQTVTLKIIFDIN